MNYRSTAAPRTCVAVLAGAIALPMMATPAAATGTEVEGSGATYYLTNDNGAMGTRVDYGRVEDKPFVGDWNGDGEDTLAVRRGNLVYVKNEIADGAADSVFSYGKAGDEVLVGDWDGDGVDTFAVRRGNEYHISNTLRSGVAQQVLHFGHDEDEVLVGDWNGSGSDGVAVRRGEQFLLNDSLASGEAEQVAVLGDGSGDAIAGAWTPGADSVGVRKGNAVALRGTDGGVTEFTYGRTSDAVLVGDWNGDGVDTLGVRRDLTPPPAPKTVAQAAPVAQSVPSRVDVVLAAARAKIGSAYVWGASGPWAFDCSGFTSHAYRAAGISLPHSSTAQRNWAASNGREVPLSQAKAGDLLWWPGHVAIYAGNGRIIDAGNVSTGVSERRLYGSPKAFRIL